MLNFVDFYHQQIVPEFQSNGVNQLLVLKIDAVKYLILFKNDLPREAIIASMASLIELLRSPSSVVSSYAVNSKDQIFVLMVCTKNTNKLFLCIVVLTIKESIKDRLCLDFF